MIELLFALLVIYFAFVYLVLPVIGGLIALAETVGDYRRFRRANKPPQLPRRRL